MKKLILIVVGAFCLIGCSVEQDELKINEKHLQTANLQYKLPAYASQKYNISNYGILQITNDIDFVYVTVSGINDYLLADLKLHIANSISEFPLTSNNNLPPGQMEYKENFNPYLSEYTFELPYSGVTDDLKFIALNSTLIKDGVFVNTWIGDNIIGKNKWAYLKYSIQECNNNIPMCTAGSNNSKFITETEAKSLPSWDEVRILYLNLLEPTVDRNGTFDPSIYELIEMFNDPNRASIQDDYTTLYTIVDGDCTASVTLNVTVIAD